MAEFAERPSPLIDPRRAAGLAALRDAARRPRILTPGTLPPGILKPSHVPQSGIISSQVEFDRAVFAYDTTTYSACSCPLSPSYYHIAHASGGTNNDLRAYIGKTTFPLYAWVWAMFGWGVGSTGTAATGRYVGCLYTSTAAAATAYVRASNVQTEYIDTTGQQRQCVWMGFFEIPASDDDQDWNIGLQVQSSVSQATNVFNRQAIIVFLSARPDDGGSNTTTDSGLA